jgi:hypothetical protein
MDKDLSTTLAGGSAGLWLLTTVKWEQMPYAEPVKLATAFALMLIGYWFYSGPKDPPAAHV